MKKINFSGAFGGSIFMILFTIFAPNIDALAKLLSKEIPALEVALFRFMIQTLLLTPFVIYKFGFIDLWPKQSLLHFIRGALIGLCSLTFFAALKVMPIADAVAIFFVEPLILTLISAIFLNEKIGWRRTTAVCVGFIGALIVIQPSFDLLGYSSLLPLAAAFLFASYLALTKIVSKDNDPIAIQFYAGFSAIIILGIANIIGYASSLPALQPVLPSLNAYILLFLLGVVATIAHLFLVLAFKRAPASLLAPLQYFEILGATLLGLVIFSEFPSIETWIGIIIIVCSGLYVIWRQSK
ncbi:MAG: EamA family transporter [Rhodospirillaceae bacterium]|nr:EamA family transporter [Rhodospirillaceae bacterium]|tara:strand:+ start:2139 stop:3029 length:891 start_codon:yes stop_codon:yes gene_type:complete